MIIIAESGSTKCDWVLIDKSGEEIRRWKTMGFNPYFQSAEVVENTLKKTEGLKDWVEKIDQVWFYGAGCSSEPARAIIKKGLDNVFVNAKNYVGHDLEASAYALYNGESVVACIIGTGSNSCFFNGNTVREEVPSLAYILGDEGSASYIGKRLLTDYLYKKLPEDLHEDFKAIYNVNKDDVLDAVYNKPNANLYLAGFGPFAGKHVNHPYIKEVVKNGFRKFIEIHVECYPEAKNAPISFVGSVAKIYEDLLSECLDEYGLKKGRIIAKPVEYLKQYHIEFLKILEQ